MAAKVHCINLDEESTEMLIWLVENSSMTTNKSMTMRELIRTEYLRQLKAKREAEL